MRKKKIKGAVHKNGDIDSTCKRALKSVHTDLPFKKPIENYRQSQFNTVNGDGNFEDTLMGCLTIRVSRPKFPHRIWRGEG